MNEEILKLAKRIGISTGGHPMNPWYVSKSEIEAFYHAAFNAGLEAAASRSAYVATSDAYYIAEQIRALELKS